MIYYPVEKALAHLTDACITINSEDYETAQKFHLRNNGKVYYAPGVGINTSLFSKQNKDKDLVTNKRMEIGVPIDSFLIISVGELNPNKNNHVILRAIADSKNSEIHYVLCGVGSEEENLRNLAKNLCIKEQVHFLGYRNDIPDLYQASDLFVLPSYREGLSRSLMEAMASGLPCVVSRIRGNVDLIDDKGGFLCTPTDYKQFSVAISKIESSIALQKSMGEYNAEKARVYDLSNVKKFIEEIYKEINKNDY